MRGGGKGERGNEREMDRVDGKGLRGEGKERGRRGNERSGRTLMNTLVLPICQSWSPSTLLQMRREVILKSVTSAIVSPGISTR